MANDKKAVGKLLGNIDLNLASDNNATLRMQVDVVEIINPFLFEILNKIPARRRAEKLRQLAVLGAMAERRLVLIT